MMETRFVVCIYLLTLFSGILSQNGNLVDVAKREGESTLVSLVVKADLTGALSDKTKQLTLFAPSNQAFVNLPAGLRNAIVSNKKFLTDVLTYHVVPGKAPSSALKNDLLVDTLSGKKIRINVYKNNTVFTASGRPINLNKVDVQATNGLFHEITGVMLPPFGNMAAAVSGCPKLKTLTTLLKKANLVSVLEGAGPFTVFTPTDAAFGKIPADQIDRLLANITLLQEVLKYHVVAGTYYSAGLSNGNVQTLNGQNVQVQISNNGVTINGNSKVIAADVTVTNGVAHAIDTVLLPPGVDLRGPNLATLFFQSAFPKTP